VVPRADTAMPWGRAPTPRLLGRRAGDQRRCLSWADAPVIRDAAEFC